VPVRSDDAEDIATSTPEPAATWTARKRRATAAALAAAPGGEVDFMNFIGAPPCIFISDYL
jgi:hypothetical protein